MASPVSTGCSRRPRSPAGCAAATSSRAWARRSSRRRARSTGCGPRAGRCPTAGDDDSPRRAPHPDARDAPARRAPPTGPGPWCWPPPTRRTPTGPPCPGPSATARPAGHRPGRKAGALVVLVDGALTLYVERGGKTLLSWTDDAAPLQSAADALALAVREGALGKITVEKADGGLGPRLRPPPGRRAGRGRVPRHAARTAATPVTGETSRTGQTQTGETGRISHHGPDGPHQPGGRACLRATPSGAPRTGSHQALAGHVLTVSDLRWPSLATVDLRGATTTEVVARGKHVLQRLDSGVTLHSHLRMDGQWRVAATDQVTAARAAPRPDQRRRRHRRVDLHRRPARHARPRATADEGTPRRATSAPTARPRLGPAHGADEPSARPAAGDRRGAAGPAAAGRHRHALRLRVAVHRAHPPVDAGRQSSTTPRSSGWSSAPIGCWRSTPAARCRAPRAACDRARRPTCTPGRVDRAGAAVTASGSR